MVLLDVPETTMTGSSIDATSATTVTAAQTNQALALKVLRAINKSNSTSIKLDDIPVELLVGETIDLHRWTLLAKDKDLKVLSEECSKYIGDKVTHCHIDCNMTDVPSMLHSFWNPVYLPKGLLSISLVGAVDITDYGLSLVARVSPSLRYINITGCQKIHDAGLREIGLYCKEITTLIMTGCNGIEGSGVVAFADECKHLMKVDISKCKTLKKWAMHKLFYECKKLEEVNVSYLQEIGDEEIIILALNCPNMIALIAKDSPFISDQGITALAQNCSDLDYIDISRERMSFRISDVTFLTLGENSKSLRILRANGCDQVTDVGLMWLAEGCKVIEELSISGASKITDAGLRSIGRSCQTLQVLNISNAKSISDVGITSIATGCPKLKKLACCGIFQLSDPRLSAPKKGAKAEEWQSVVGIAALTQSCPLLEDVDLSGCFRLNLALQRHISCLTNLKILNLTGCNQCTPSALEGIADGCRHIENITLNDCGKAVNNSVIQLLCKNSRQLKVMVLRRCNHVTGVALKSIASLLYLEKLDLTECKSLSDIMVLPITETDKLPVLRSLTLNHIDLITDTTLAWLASKTHTIYYLSLKGTRITKHALTAVRDRFPYTEIIQTDEFFGFLPVTRLDDKRLILRYDIMRTGVIKIQARQRAHLAKVRVRGISVVRRYEAAIVSLHRFALIALARTRFYYEKKAYNIRQTAAIKLTSMFWIAKAKKRRQRRMMELHQQRVYRSVTKIQTRYRIVIAKRTRQRKWDAYIAYLNRRRLNAIVIQCMARVYFSKRRVLHIKQMRKAKQAIIDRKVRLIQRCYRGMVGRGIARAGRVELYRKNVLMKRSTSLIQQAFRRYRTRKICKTRYQHKQLLTLCATKIQSCMRGALARLMTREVLLEIHEARLNRASLHIQNRWRVKQAQLELRRLKEDMTNLGTKMDAAAVVMQKYIRRKLARHVLKNLKEEYLQSLRNAVELEIWAATTIQSAYRGMKGRLHFDEELRIKKGKWKELFDNEKNQRFFYNKITGEIRWRMPQDLLDLIPKPACDNCNYYLANFECHVCNEVFCNECFDNVHRGGRRRDHDFRCLYDYYGRRIDYGDGSFPCKWPSEVLQDEVQGWMLRVAPIRDPTAVYQEWEEYTDIDPLYINNSVEGSMKTFYFNRQTFETTYDMPYEVSKLKQSQLQDQQQIDYSMYQYVDDSNGGNSYE